MVSKLPGKPNPPFSYTCIISTSSAYPLKGREGVIQFYALFFRLTAQNKRKRLRIYVTAIIRL